MTQASSGPLTNEPSTLPIARIDTMDVPFVLPIREYLHTNGCQVFVNTGPTENVTYYLVVGDDDFVKRTLAFRHDFGKKQYIICWGVNDKEMLFKFLSPKSKIAFVDPKPLTDFIINDLFSFFFIGKKHEMDFSSKEIEKKPVTVNAQPSYKEQEKQTTTLTRESLKQEKETDAAKRIEATIADVFDLPKKKAHTQPKEKAPEEPPPTKQKRDLHTSPVLPLVLATISIFLCPIILFFTATLFRTWTLTNSITCFKKGNISCSKKRLEQNQFWETYQKFPLPLISSALSLIGKESYTESIERLVFLFDTIAEIEKEMIPIGESGTAIFSSFFAAENTSDTSSPVVAVDTLRKSIPTLKTQLDIAYATVATLKHDDLMQHPILQKKITEGEEKIKTFRSIGEMGEQVAQLYPYFSGFKDKQEILIALQNNSELRPTGGFIGSLMRATISDGIIDQINVEDVYTLDGQLKGHVDPPEPIQTILNQEHWYLRDSNWDPDFSKSAAMIRWFYEKEGGGNIDTVIGVTASFVVKLLAVLGPVDLPQYNDKITADNFYAKSLYYIHTNFFPGSTNKKDFLGSLLETLIAKAQKNKESSGIALLETLTHAILSRDIQWYTMKADGQSVLERFGWAGTLPTHNTCAIISDKTPCTFSFLHINEANLGVNKANVFIKRQQERTIEIDVDGIINETIVRKIQNTAGSEIGGGDYTVVARFFIPTDSTVTNVSLDGSALPEKDAQKKKNTLPFWYTNKGTGGLTTIVTNMVIPTGKEHTIKLSYTHTTPLRFGENGAIFTSLEQKQAGVDSVLTTTRVIYPSSWSATILVGDKGAVVANKGKLEYNNTLIRDNEYTIQFNQ